MFLIYYNLNLKLVTNDISIREFGFLNFNKYIFNKKNTTGMLCACIYRVITA